jgi:hypothetical protein
MTGPTGSPTVAEVRAFLAYLERGSIDEAARDLGITRSAMKNRLADLRHRVHARNNAHAAWLLWPVLGRFYRLPQDASLDERTG